MCGVNQKVAIPLKTFCNILTQAKDTFMTFCQFVANLSPHTQIYQFWSIYLNS